LPPRYLHSIHPNDLESAWAVWCVARQCADACSWEFGAAYYSVEKDALFAQLSDNDLGNGLTDAARWVLGAGYSPMKSVTLNATDFINKRNVDVANIAGQKDVEHYRLQLDFNIKF
jgi:hypothetical protein